MSVCVKSLGQVMELKLFTVKSIYLCVSEVFFFYFLAMDIYFLFVQLIFWAFCSTFLFMMRTDAIIGPLARWGPPEAILCDKIALSCGEKKNKKQNPIETAFR